MAQLAPVYPRSISALPHLRYHDGRTRRVRITKKKDLTCPQKIFWRDLIKQIKSWREARDRIILFMDHNEHVTNRPLGKELGDKNGLDMREAIIQHTGASPGATFSVD